MASINLIETTLNTAIAQITASLPSILTGLLFLTIAYAVIQILQRVIRASLTKIHEPDQTLITNLIVIIISIFLWFGTALTFLKIVGMGDIATSLGTSVGFIALGIAYALSDMIADTVAGIYLLRDPDFNPGDAITTATTTGTVTEIGLRKSRFILDNGDTTVLANRDVEKKWTKTQPTTNAPDA